MKSLRVSGGTKITSWPCCPHGDDRSLLPFSNRAVRARPAFGRPPDFGLSLLPLRGATAGRGIRLVLRRLRFEELPVHLPGIFPGRLLRFRAAANDGGSDAEHRKQPQRSNELRVFH
jgi:hypothetical protein